MTKIHTSLTGTAEASLTVLLTTLEDCVWLVPLVAHAATPSIALAHALIFVATFTGLAISIAAAAVLLQEGLASHVKQADLWLEAVGAILCWSLAAFFYYKTWAKKRRKQRQREQQELRHADVEYGAVATNDEGSKQQQTEHGESADSNSNSTDSIQAWMIISLTIAGSLDEISYFPSLIVGKIFTPTELVLGTLLASLLILCLVDLLVRRCTRCLHVLDQVPLYAVIGLFAVILTLEVVWDLAT